MSSENSKGHSLIDSLSQKFPELSQKTLSLLCIAFLAAGSLMPQNAVFAKGPTRGEENPNWAPENKSEQKPNGAHKKGPGKSTETPEPTETPTPIETPVPMAAGDEVLLQGKSGIIYHTYFPMIMNKNNHTRQTRSVRIPRSR